MAQIPEERRTGTTARLRPKENRKLALFAARMGFPKARALEFLVQEYLTDDGVPEMTERNCTSPECNGELFERIENA